MTRFSWQCFYRKCCL